MTDDEDTPDARVIFEQNYLHGATSVRDALREMLATMSGQAAEHLPDWLTQRSGTAMMAVATIGVSNGECLEIQLQLRRLSKGEARD